MGTASLLPRDADIGRPRLDVRLRASAAGRLTLVTAGAGYGKTTLLRSWAAPIRAAWHTLTPADRVSSSLAGNIVDALRVRLPDLSADMVVAASRTGGHDTDELNRAEASAAALADALAGALRRPAVLVLDDVDEIAAAPESARLVSALIRQAPRGLHVVLAGRGRPWLSTSRLLAHGDATELGAHDLAFTVEETAELVRLRMGGSQQHVAEQIHAATGGWPVATRLAVEAVKSSSDRERVLESLREPSGLLVEYMVDEVLDRESAEVVDLLRRGEALDGFDADLATHVGVVDAAQVLSTAARRGVFVEAHPARPGRVTLTSLCRMALRRAGLLASAERDAVMRTAAEWHEGRGEAADALLYWSRLRDHEAVRRVLLDRGDDLLRGGEAQAVIEAVGVVASAERPHDAFEMLAGDGWMLLGDWDAALSCYSRATPVTGPVPARLGWRVGLVHYIRGELDDAAKAFDDTDPDDPDLVARALTAGWSASVCWLRGELEAGRERAVRALADARASRDHRALANAHTVAAMLAALDGDRDLNDTHYLQALDHAQAAGDVLQLVRIHSNRSSHHLEEGNAHDAVAEADLALRLADLAGLASFRAMALTNRGEALVMLGRLDEARVEVEAARSVFERLGSPMVSYALAALGDVHRLRGDTAAARRAYDRAYELARVIGDTQGMVPALAGCARLILADDPEEAARLAALAVDAGPSMAQVGAVLAAANADLARGDADGAAHHAETALARARGQRDRVGVAEALEVLGAARRDVEIVAASVGQWVELNSPLNLARAQTVLAELERSPESVELAFEAVERAQALGAHGVAAPASARLDELRAVAAPEIQLVCLGEFTVVRDRITVAASAWQSRKAREALRLLVCRRGRSIAREQMAELLWPDEELSRTANRLSVALSTIRTVLDPERRHQAEYYLRADADTVALDLSHVEVDVERFLEHAAAGLALLRAGRRTEARRRLQVAEVLYVGDLFEDDPYQDWCVDLRERARMTYLEVAGSLADLAERDGDRTAQARYLLRVLERDPYDEHAHLALVRALLAQGRHGEARRRYRMYARRMEEIDVEAASYPD